MKAWTIAVTLVLCAARNVDGALFIFSGTITSVEDPAGILDGSISPLLGFSGTFAFNPTTARSVQGANHAVYPVNVDAFTTQIGNYQLESDYKIIVHSDAGTTHTDGYELEDESSGDVVFTNGLTTFQINWNWHIQTPNALGSVVPSLDLPSSSLDLGLFDSREFYLRCHNTSGMAVIRGTVQQLELVPSPFSVPEPSAVAIWSILALCGMKLRRWRGQKSV